MAVSGKLYAKLSLAAFNKEHDLSADSIKVMLTTSTYSPSQSGDDYKNDVTNEVSGTGYTATGVALTTKTETMSSLTYTFDADDVSWTASTFTARYAVVYNATGGGTDATRGLIGYQDFGGDQSVSGTTFTITWNASGIFTVVVA